MKEANSKEKRPFKNVCWKVNWTFKWRKLFSKKIKKFESTDCVFKTTFGK